MCGGGGGVPFCPVTDVTKAWLPGVCGWVTYRPIYFTARVAKHINFIHRRAPSRAAETSLVKQ